jgi:putative transposase
MVNYRRRFQPGGCYFFTVVTFDRSPWLCLDWARRLLRVALVQVRRARPFTIEAFVLLPDHLHCLWRLPEGDADYPTRWQQIKRFLSQHRDLSWPLPELSESRIARKEISLWQRRFWEHTIREASDWRRHCDYIHYNPVKHGLCLAPKLWPYSSFHRFVKKGLYELDWASQCPPKELESMDIE